jgi:membrane protein implicated in regulation of membrane protease activity
VNWLASAVAWSALIACCLSIISEFRGRRERREEQQRRHDTAMEEQRAAVEAAFDRGRSSRDAEFARCEKDRDYWRDIVVRRAERDRGE